MLKVVHIGPGGVSARGGMGRLLAYLTEALRMSGQAIEVRVLDSYGPGPFALMPLYFCALCLRLPFAAARADVVHIHTAAFGSALRKLALVRLCKMMGRPTVLHIHGAEFADYYGALRPPLRRLIEGGLKAADRVIVLGSYWQRFFVETVGLSAEKVVVVHNGVPFLPLPERTEDEGSCLLLALGELGARKGTPETIAALRQLAGSHPNWRAVLAGNGAVDEFRAQVAGSPLAGRVELPGWVDKAEARDLLARAHVLLLPSHNEGLPVAILEAMAAGLAVIATPVGAIEDAVVNGETGLIVPPGDSNALARAIARLLDDPDLRHRMGEAGRQRFVERFTIAEAARRVINIYRDLLQLGPLPDPGLEPGRALEHADTGLS